MSIRATISASAERETAFDKDAVRRRRNASPRVRQARDRLTSTSGTTSALDAELLRQLAHHRLSGSLVIIMLACSLGLLSGCLTGVVTAGIWMVAVLLIHPIILLTCLGFLADAPGPQQIRTWRLRFILLDLLFGLAWMFDLLKPIGVGRRKPMFRVGE